ncbi:MAG: hypothetical protein C0200_03875 [Thermoproteota archaeon]|nr:MAG: hypothetical protein C0200_03875 [Candidatus Korarchaeota archaeon]
MIIFTTSRYPSQRTRSFLKDLCRVIPGAVKVNRGKSSIMDLSEKAIRLGASRLVIIDQIKGNPSRMRFFDVTKTPPEPNPRAVLFSGVALRREITERRAPKVETIEVAFSDESIRELSNLLGEGMGISVLGNPIRSEELGKVNSDVVLFVHLNKKLTISFFLTDPVEELGPRIYVKGVGYLFDRNRDKV